MYSVCLSISEARSYSSVPISKSLNTIDDRGTSMSGSITRSASSKVSLTILYFSFRSRNMLMYCEP